MPDSNAVKTADVEAQLARLKPFQRRTVDYVFRRFYEDNRPAYRFLVADEVGLGKTMVARGVIARTIERLRHDRRVDVLYICSNASIARQNVARLNVTGNEHASLATRPTMLLRDLAGGRSPRLNRVNFVSFTPGTMDTVSQTGLKEERALLYRVLLQETRFEAGLRTMLRCGVTPENWQTLLENATQHWEIDHHIADAFVADIRQRPELIRELDDLAATCQRGNNPDDPSLSVSRSRLVGTLRKILAEHCIRELEPDLVILDEFQRFRQIMNEETGVGELAHHLFNYRDPDGHRARTLLLSATPYLMPLARDDDGVDHYKDFINTLGFLFDDTTKVEALKHELADYRAALYEAGNQKAGRLERSRDAVETRLRSVMVRTERVGSTAEMNSMVRECPADISLNREDVGYGVALEKLAYAVDGGGAVEFWKSAGYVLNFMHQSYKLRDRLSQATSLSQDALRAAHDLKGRQLRKRDVQRYKSIEEANARQRYLHGQTLDRELWRLLWLPASLGYVRPRPPFDKVTDATKHLVFCSWDAAPNSIAALCSYEAERRMFAASGDFPQQYDRYSQQYRPLRLDLDQRTGHPNNMAGLTLLYPCVTLARSVDPLRLALDEASSDGGPPAQEQVFALVKAHVESLLTAAGVPEHQSEAETDPRWYWAALARLDGHFAPEMRDWVTARGSRSWLANLSGRDNTNAQHYMDWFRAAMDGGGAVGENPPGDLPDVIARVALAGPGVSALRALKRCAPGLEMTDRVLLSGAARIADGFRTLFNQPDTVALVRSTATGVAYWRAVLRYAQAGDLQAVLDEYAHVLIDASGAQEADDATRAATIADKIHEAVGLLGGTVGTHEFYVRDGQRFDPKNFRIRTRFALRLSDTRDTENQELRIDQIRHAFNSPFRPFVLATTSIGQEGLDFHPYCHAVHHWNLPATPVEMEQREGRVHRYKGHAIRRNLSAAYGLNDLPRAPGDGGGLALDPWAQLFELADSDSPDHDLVPYWIFERSPEQGGVQVERHLPHLPYSKDSQRLELLRRSLAIYRLAFGQPRQEDLIRYLESTLGTERARNLADRWQIRLAPP